MTNIKAQISYYNTINDDNSKKKMEEYKEKLIFTEKALDNLKQKIERDTEEDKLVLCALMIIKNRFLHTVVKVFFVVLVLRDYIKQHKSVLTVERLLI
jgi:hypothetical protein